MAIFMFKRGSKIKVHHVPASLKEPSVCELQARYEWVLRSNENWLHPHILSTLSPVFRTGYRGKKKRWSKSRFLAVLSFLSQRNWYRAFLPYQNTRLLPATGNECLPASRSLGPAPVPPVVLLQRTSAKFARHPRKG